MIAAATRDSVSAWSIRPGEVRRPKERREHEPFGSVGGDQRELVHATRLTESIHASRALFQPARIPWELVVDHQAASLMKVQAFRRGISGEQDPAAFVEGQLHTSPIGWRERAVKDRDRVPGRRQPFARAGRAYPDTR